MMSAILAFQFKASAAREEKKRASWAKVVGIAGAVVAFSLAALALWRMAWFLIHHP